MASIIGLEELTANTNIIVQQLLFSEIWNRQVVRTEKSMSSSSDLPLLEEFVLLPSGTYFLVFIVQ